MDDTVTAAASPFPRPLPIACPPELWHRWEGRGEELKTRSSLSLLPAPRLWQTGDGRGIGRGCCSGRKCGNISDSCTAATTPADHLGSTTYLTNETGDVAEQTEYTPWGEMWYRESDAYTGLNFSFTGKELDGSTGFYYFGARYYDPKTSVWISPDPILNEYLDGDIGMGGIYNSRNLGMYTYTHNNPIRLIDPDGRDAKGISFGITGEVGLSFLWSIAFNASFNLALCEDENNNLSFGGFSNISIFGRFLGQTGGYPNNNTPSQVFGESFGLSIMGFYSDNVTEISDFKGDSALKNIDVWFISYQEIENKKNEIKALGVAFGLPSASVSNYKSNTSINFDTEIKKKEDFDE